MLLNFESFFFNLHGNATGSRHDNGKYHSDYRNKSIGLMMGQSKCKNMLKFIFEDPAKGTPLLQKLSGYINLHLGIRYLFIVKILFNIYIKLI